MKEELEDQLRESFPLFTGCPAEHGLTPINCDDGWFNLIYSLFTTLSQLKSPLVVSVTARNGKLHVSIPSASPAVEGAVAMAQNASIFICEKCGAPGKLCLALGEQHTLCAVHTEVDLT